MNAAPPLRSVQLGLWRLLAAPEGVESGIAQLTAAGELPAGWVDDVISGDERVGPAGRVDIYANMYFYRLLESLAEDFEATAKVLGEARFHNLVTDYLLAHPPSHWSLRYLGRDLPAFLSSHALSSDMPHLADLAALEWARNEAFQAMDAPVLEARALAAVPPESFADLSFTPAPWLHVVSARCDVAGLWERLSRGEPPGEVPAVDQHLAVFRRDLDFHHEVVSAEEAEALRDLAAGRTFGEICERVAGASVEPARNADLEAAAERAAGFLSRWLERELISGYTLRG